MRLSAAYLLFEEQEIKSSLLCFELLFESQLAMTFVAFSSQTILQTAWELAIFLRTCDSFMVFYAWERKHS